MFTEKVPLIPAQAPVPPKMIPEKVGGFDGKVLETPVLALTVVVVDVKSKRNAPAANPFTQLLPPPPKHNVYKQLWPEMMFELIVWVTVHSPVMKKLDRAAGNLIG